MASRYRRRLQDPYGPHCADPMDDFQDEEEEDTGDDESDLAIFEGMYGDGDDDTDIPWSSAQHFQYRARGGAKDVASAPPPSGIAAVWQRLRHLSDSGILVQALGLPLRHVLAAWGFSMLLRGKVGRRTVAFATALWAVSGLGVTAGAHRLWTHQSYHASPMMEWLLMIMFSNADQGPIRGWTLTHAMHHFASDTARDPHNRQEGWWHAHFGWLYSDKRFILPSREHDRVLRGHGPAVRFHDRHFTYWDPLWSHVIPGLIAGLWGEPKAGFLFAGAFRWFCVQHITFFVNSIAHGEREPGDQSLFDATADGIGPRVSPATTLLALGEGWHDYHHLFPWDYAAAELDAWDQWNPTKVFIDACSSVGLVSARRRCSRTLQEARRRQLLSRAAELNTPGAGKAAELCSFKTRGPVFFRQKFAVPGAA